MRATKSRPRRDAAASFGSGLWQAIYGNVVGHLWLAAIIVGGPKMSAHARVSHFTYVNRRVSALNCYRGAILRTRQARSHAAQARFPSANHAIGLAKCFEKILFRAPILSHDQGWSRRRTKDKR